MSGTRTLAAAGLALSAACATAPATRADMYTYVAEGHSMESEADVRLCARNYLGATQYDGVPSRSDERVQTAYGPATVSHLVNFTAARAEDATVLKVFVRSQAYPESGRGEFNSNVVRIAPTAEGKARADALLQACATA